MVVYNTVVKQHSTVAGQKDLITDSEFRGFTFGAEFHLRRRRLQHNPSNYPLPSSSQRQWQHTDRGRQACSNMPALRSRDEYSRRETLGKDSSSGSMPPETQGRPNLPAIAPGQNQQRGYLNGGCSLGLAIQRHVLRIIATPPCEICVRLVTESSVASGAKRLSHYTVSSE